MAVVIGIFCVEVAGNGCVLGREEGGRIAEGFNVVVDTVVALIVVVEAGVGPFGVFRPVEVV